MLRMANRIAIFIILCFSFYFQFCFAQENITITTYYPSPYGSYRELRVQRLALGENYSITSQYCWDGVCTNYIDDDSNPGTPTNVDLVVEGFVGIGAYSIPQGTKLYVHGPATSGFIGIDGDDNAGIRISKLGTTAGIIELGDPAGQNNLRIRSEAGRGLDLGSNATQGRLFISTNGFVGIGTSTPSVRLHVSGPSSAAIRITDGNQGTGRVLTSDANGVGTWQAKLTCQVVNAGGSSQSASVNCPGGTVMTGGGCRCSGSPADGTEDLLNSYPSNANTWNCSTSSTDRHVAAYAICCN